MTDRTTPATPVPATTLWSTYALRAWLAALLTQALQNETQVKYRIEDLETETKRLRAQLDRATPVIQSLQQTIRKVDDAIRRIRDVDLAAAQSEPTHPAQAETPQEETQAPSGDDSREMEPRQTPEMPPSGKSSGRQGRRKR